VSEPLPPEPVDLAPPRALVDRVAAFWRHGGCGAKIRVLPDGCMDFWFDLESGRARLIGAMTEAFVVTIPAGGRYFGVRFQPGVAAEYFAETAREFVDLDAPLADVTEAGRFGLAERVAEARDHAGRVAAVTTFLESPAHRSRAADHRVRRAVRLLRRDPTGASVQGIASALGVSARQLERLFAERLGYGPKQFARIVRLERAVLLMHTPLRGQAVLAAAAGYADESHLIREFRALAGTTPAELARERHVGFVQAGPGLAR
jgi:AraC-like DNA-binding protein